MFDFITIRFLQNLLIIFIVLYNTLAAIFTVRLILRKRKKYTLSVFIFTLEAFVVLFYIATSIFFLSGLDF